ncbi:MoaD/ThiS family protein [Amphritea japonica]|uniref:Molybdopterin synthase sulfur carrier subunit n=1 Tax=Amphritea japonica ATCC BAA-1530 TaxID=1278309 RepID=A0A7R6P9S7_9GAMM|nr:MoaD/ThiS family protein [Amphritea japonica]BBB25478.1 molybdopterin synthase sulfur carrier subunit [Amphritea japonica ATCC BAA-1530]
MVKVLFFASLRETLGVDEISHQVDGSINAAELLTVLKGRGEGWSKALDGPLLCSVNQEVAPLDVVISDGDEVAFFPPVTGG